jgi:predicted TIM-barrel fold metal-dependent hydrolase
MKKKLNLTGLDLNLIVECFRPDYPFFAKFFQKTAHLNLPILFHAGHGFSSPGLIKTITRRHPNLAIILGHPKE